MRRPAILSIARTWNVAIGAFVRLRVAGIFLAVMLSSASNHLVGSTPDPPVWPKIFDLSAARVETEISPPDGERSAYRYSGRHFEMFCDEKLSGADVAAMFTVLESIEPAMRALPLPILSSRPRGRPYRVRVFPDEQRYLDHGGMPGSVGMYSARHRETLMLHSSLFGHTARSVPRKTSRPEDRYDVLVHEVTHQVMARWASVLPPWYSEGHAEYLAVAHDRPGHFQFENMQGALVKHIEKYVLRGTKPLSVPSIARLLAMGNRQWLRDNKLDSDENYHKYAGALVLTHYYYHLESRNGEAVRNFLQALLDGDSPVRATKAHLVGDRDFQEIEKKLIAYWARYGLSLKFVEE